MHDIAASNHANIIEFTGYMMNIFSIVVALVLGFLVIYANQLLITRRKREFGIYLVLGMKPGQVSRILLYETVFIGLGSLILGLGLGVLISQLLSFATAALFGIAMPQYQFSFSPGALDRDADLLHRHLHRSRHLQRHHRATLQAHRPHRRKGEASENRHPQPLGVSRAPSSSRWFSSALPTGQLDINGMTLMFDAEFQRATVLMLVGLAVVLLLALRLCHRRAHASAWRLLQALASLYHAPGRIEVQHLVRLHLGGVRAALLRHHHLCHGTCPRRCLHR